MTGNRTRLPETGLREHLMFLALLIPTFVVIAAAAISLFAPDESSMGAAAVETVAVCGPCRSYDSDE